MKKIPGDGERNYSKIGFYLPVGEPSSLEKKIIENLNQNSHKIYIPDSNVFILDPYCIFYLSGNTVPPELFDKYSGFGNLKKSEPNNIVVPSIVLEELNYIKDDHKNSDYVRYMARRALDSVRYIAEKAKKQGENLNTGVTLENNAKFFVYDISENQFLKWIENQKIMSPNNENDYRLLFAANTIKNYVPNKDVIIVSEDTDIYTKSVLKNLNIDVQYYRKDRIESYKDVYDGKIIVELDSEDLLKKYVINRFLSYEREKNFSQLSIPLREFIRDFDLNENLIYPNQVIVFKVQDMDNLIEKHLCNEIFLYNIVSGDKNEIIPPIPFLKYISEVVNLRTKVQRDLFSEKFSSKEDIDPTRLLDSLSSLYSKISKKRKNLSAKEIFDKILKWTEDIKIKYFDSDSYFTSFKTAIERSSFFENTYPKYEQIPYFNLLLDQSIKVVSVIGEQGAGKSYLALAVGLYYVYKGYVEKVSYLRPLEEIGGRGFGYLPGSEKEKMAPWKEAVKDNLIEMFSEDSFDYEENQRIRDFVNNLEEKYGILEYLPPQFLQGRTLNRRFIIVDEGQNFTRAMLRVILGRVGRSSKIVILGDPTQIPAINSNFDRLYSGIAHVANALKDDPITAHYTFPSNFSERSYVSRLASRL
ncbi:MAG: PhoH family protein [Candidatus Woesearchaeota archaeon]